MRILHVVHGWPPAEGGGTELYAAALSEAQRRAGATVGHWTPRALRARRLPFRRTFDRPEAETSFKASFHQLRPDIVHIHHLTGASMGIPVHAREMGARVVVTLHDAWLACARGQLVDRELKRCEGPDDLRCARCLAPALWAPVPARYALRLPLRLDPIRARRAALTRLLAAADVVLSPSRHLPERIGIPAVWLPLPLLRPIPIAPPAPPGPVRFLFLGGLLHTKGPHLALEAFARLPAGAATLRIIGPPLPWRGSLAYVEALRARVREVPGASLEGAADPCEVPGILADSDVFVFPSTWEENSPLVLREAAAAGLRVVASDVPGASEVLGARGARFEADSVDALRGALAVEVRRGRSRDAALPCVDIDTHTRRVLDVYRGILGEEGGDTGAHPL